MKTQPSPINPVAYKVPVRSEGDATDCVDFAQVCCARAKEAAQRGRMQSARGLVKTAVSLYERAVRESAGKDGLSSRLSDLSEHLCLCVRDIDIAGLAQMTVQQDYAA
ncbi:MAG TPA: hypothetical protein VF719_11185 [Abditibacteriaceae bacterium]|jgi:hypothetical protein